jgi:hypothetical protein
MKEVEPENRLPIQQYMYRWYGRLMSGKLRGLAELQQSITRGGRNKMKGYAAFLNANRGNMIGAGIAVFLLFGAVAAFGAWGGLPVALVASVPASGFTAGVTLQHFIRYTKTVRDGHSISNRGVRAYPTEPKRTSHSKSKSRSTQQKDKSHYKTNSKTKSKSKSKSKSNKYKSTSRSTSN